jgi:hypothetical protein
MFKLIILTFILFLLTLNVLSFFEIVLFNSAKILAINNGITTTCWIFRKDDEEEKN